MRGDGAQHRVVGIPDTLKLGVRENLNKKQIDRHISIHPSAQTVPIRPQSRLNGLILKASQYDPQATCVKAASQVTHVPQPTRISKGALPSKIGIDNLRFRVNITTRYTYRDMTLTQRAESHVN